jgi:hypothetical protein
MMCTIFWISLMSIPVAPLLISDFFFASSKKTIYVVKSNAYVLLLPRCNLQVMPRHARKKYDGAVPTYVSGAPSDTVINIYHSGWRLKTSGFFCRTNKQLLHSHTQLNPITRRTTSQNQQTTRSEVAHTL